VTKETGYGHSYASDSSKSPYQSDKKDFSAIRDKSPTKINVKNRLEVKNRPSKSNKDIDNDKLIIKENNGELT